VALDDEELIAKTDRLIAQIFEGIHTGVAKPPMARGRSLPQIKLIKHLYLHGPCMVGEVAGALGVSMPSASEMIDKLVDEGLVERRTNPDDRRQVLVSLTAAAREVGDQIHRLRRAQMRAVIERFEPHEWPYLLRTLEVLAEVLRMPAEALERGATAETVAGEQGVGNRG
jgi:DNA-binding MarR family transcriptional regulator